MAKTTIPVYHPPKSSSPKPPKKSSGGGGGHKSGGGGGHKSGGGSKGGGGGGGGDPYKKAQGAAANRFAHQAANMAGQIRALKHALNYDFEKNLRQRLANIKLVSGQQQTQLDQGYKLRLGSLNQNNADNEKAVGDSTAANQSNRARERTNSITEALNMGAGESDVLRSQMMSLRSWDANQGEVLRSYFDSKSSLNSALTDLNVDTKTARINAQTQANADRDQVYSQYYDQRGETWTNLGNALGMQGELYGMANEQKSSGKYKSAQSKAAKGASTAFANAAKVAGKAYKNPGTSQNLLDWKGQGPYDSETGLSKIENAAQIPEAKKPEGASLRKWTT